MSISLDDSRAGLLTALRARRPEIDRSVLARVRAIGGAGNPGDAEYLDGLRRAVDAAIGHTIDSIGRTEDSPLPVPLPLLSQARLAARRRVPLETMLRRYLAGHAIIADFVAEETARQDAPPTLIAHTLRSLAARTDLTVAAIGAAYVQEQTAGARLSANRRRAELVRRLLDGELVDPSALGYELDRWHLALVLRGADARDAVDVVAGLDARRLVVPYDDRSVWVWLGSRERIEPGSIAAAMRADLPADLRVGIGEAGRGEDGWRLSHQQARAALAVALLGPATHARYRDVALVAATLQDDLLAASLRRLYLEPLEAERDGGVALRETLRAYVACERNVSSTAVALGLTRKTINSRLRAAEQHLGRPLAKCAVELELSLQVEALPRGSSFLKVGNPFP